MNLGPLTIKHIPQGKELINDKVYRCKYAFNNECQLLNKECDGIKRKSECKLISPKKKLY